MQLKKIIIFGTLGITTAFGAGDALILNEVPVSRAETIKGNEVRVEQVGNVVEATLPWKDQAGLKVKVDLGEPTLAEQLADKRKKEVVTEVIDQDKMKIDFLLNKKPDTNLFCQQFEGHEEYDFFYQPELTKEEIDEGALRPENVVGSYAVYHKTLKNHRVGSTNYETGKAFHIYRPEVWEVNDDTVRTWAELSYDGGELCVTVPQDFLDKAVYPVRVDPTFGYTSIGASTSIVNNGILGTEASLLEDGGISSFSFYSKDWSEGISVKGGLYNSSDEYTSNETEVITSGTANVWTTANFASSVAGSAGTYGLAIMGSGSVFHVASDTAGTHYFDSTDTYPNWRTPLAQESTLKKSIYATYTVPDPNPDSDVYFKSGNHQIKSGNVQVK